MEKFFQSADFPERWQKDVRFKKTKEFRPPKKGEWYISGAIPEAYKAFNDLDTPFWIAKRVIVRLIPSHYEEV